jgi:hypothetical protein
MNSVDITHTVSPKEAKGRELHKNLDNGEVFWITPGDGKVEDQTPAVEDAAAPAVEDAAAPAVEDLTTMAKKLAPTKLAAKVK